MRVSGEEDMHIILKNDLGELNRLPQLVKDYVVENQLDNKWIFRLTLVLEEMVTNIISYGYPRGNQSTIEITFTLKDNSLVIMLKDYGQPFNPLTAPEPDTKGSMEERKVGGLGIHLVKNMMDQLSYHREGESNVLVMKKELSQ